MVIFRHPYREYLIIVFTLIALGVYYTVPGTVMFLLVIALIGSLSTAWGALKSIVDREITIDTFNIFALAVSFGTGEIPSAAFIVLMLAFAAILDWQTESRARSATKELLKLKPTTAFMENAGELNEVPVEAIKKDDILVVKSGGSVPVDGTVIFGSAFMNEASVSGESDPVEKFVGDRVMSGTLIDSGTIKIKATNVGKDSTIERMIALMKEAAINKSRSEKIANRFARYFLPVVIAVGAGTYWLTGNIKMTAAIFLVACADDMAVAIPLAVTAAIGKAAKRGIVIKGGEWLESLSKIKTLIIDKTGTLTYGIQSVEKVEIDPSVTETDFWRSIAIAEKFSEHPISRAVLKEAGKYTKDIPDPDKFKVYKGSGVHAHYKETEIVVGDESIIKELNIPVDSSLNDYLASERKKYGKTTFIVFINKKFAGLVVVADSPRPEAKKSLDMLRELGVGRIIMFTGDDENTAKTIADTIGITEVRASMSPEDKLRELEEITKNNPTAMVGDGINDAPSLSRADVGIAMGGSGAAVAVEAADVIVLTDDLSRLSEMVLLGRQTMSVVRGDMVIWLLSNLLGFALVLTGIAGPALAAFYNFGTDFLPLINSAKLFNNKLRK